MRLDPFLDFNAFRRDAAVDANDDDSRTTTRMFEAQSTSDPFLMDIGGYHSRSGFRDEQPSLFFRSVTTRGHFLPKNASAKKGEKKKGVFAGEYNPIYQMSEENNKSVLGRFECGRTSATVSAKENGLFCDQELLFEALVASVVGDPIVARRVFRDGERTKSGHDGTAWKSSAVKIRRE